ncbi:MerC domain-containing protein [Sphingomonas xinjiangensis]|uniref:MerC mercury resistance protein n=1 Tax=Sphingomonas xinjiangensis TaxID=643568 RepID=A0A840YPY2_9SPHN|nr:MerC domain-containing protein [Sphingomonas xinjiangensis]MBB5710252.1 hypothetical protein [Sphingomonas xinjiangensis]
MQRQTWLDGAAASVSLLCLVHCLALPLLIAALPALSQVLAVPEGFHRGVALIALPASSVALLSGFRRHRSARALALAVLGLGAIGWGAFGAQSASAELVATVIGSVLVSAAHVVNWALAQARARH